MDTVEAEAVVEGVVEVVVFFLERDLEEDFRRLAVVEEELFVVAFLVTVAPAAAVFEWFRCWWL